MFGCTASQAWVEIETVGWESLAEIGFLRGVADRARAVENTQDETTLPQDELTQLVKDAIEEREYEKLQARKRRNRKA